jgi:hypothetical protein
VQYKFATNAVTTAAMNRFALIVITLLLGCSHAKAQSPELSSKLSIVETTKLIQSTRKAAIDPMGWAIDLLDVMEEQDLPTNRENICSAIAIIDQESNFVADPAVAGLGTLAEKTLRTKADRIPILGRVALQFLATTPSPKNSYLDRIRNARTERDLDMTYRSMVDDASKRTSLSFVVQSGLFNQLIEERNNISTIGSMQVSVKFAIGNIKRRRWLPMSLSDVYGVRDELYTRRGGMYYGVLQLLGYQSGYNRKIYRFADYNAGRYASRNAAFQKIIAKLSNTNLATDGDLLLYDKSQQAISTVSQSENALRTIIAAHQLNFTNKQLRSQLLKEKDADFPATKIYQVIRDRYVDTIRQPITFADIPSIELNSPKIRNHMTTKNFAESVDRRYKKCMAAK